VIPRILIVPATAVDATGVDSVVVAGAVELLRRRSRCELFIAASHDLKLPETQLADDANLVDALAGCSLTAIVGRLAGPGLSRAAEIAFMARLLDVPVALISVSAAAEQSAEEAALLHALASTAVSATAADAASAASLGRCRGRCVEVVAPLELLARTPEANAAPDGFVVGCDAALMHHDRDGAFEALGVALRDVGATLRVFGSAVLVPEDVTCERLPDESVASVLAAIAGCTLVIAPGESILHVLATGAGVPAIALAQPGKAPWHQRLGSADLVVPGDLESLRRCLTTARAGGRARVVQRVVPLRAVAWRALGPLAEVRSGAWILSGALASPVAGAVARACARIVAPLLAAGDASRAEAMLSRWEGVLATEPAWSCARARAYVLQGRDADAITVLERALAVHSCDLACRVELARAWTRQGAFARARAVWAELASDHPADAAPPAEIAHLALLQGDAATALASWAEALRRDPQHAGSIRAVRALLDTEPHREAEFWAGLCARHSDQAGFWQAHGLASVRAIEWDAAERSLRRALELDPSAHAAREALSAALERRDPIEPHAAAESEGTPAAPVAGASIGRL